MSWPAQRPPNIELCDHPTLDYSRPDNLGSQSILQSTPQGHEPNMFTGLDKLQDRAGKTSIEASYGREADQKKKNWSIFF